MSVLKATSKVVQGGRISIPKAIRDALAIKDGDYVEIMVSKVEQK